MNNYKRILSLILALILTLSPFTTAFAQTKTPVEKTRTGAQEVQIGDEIYYIFSKDKNAKRDLINAQEKSEKKTEAIQRSDGLDLSDNLFGRPVGAGQTTPYTLNIKGTNFKGVGGKTFDWDTLPEGLELQVFYIDEEGFDYNVGNPITINKSNYQDVITRTFDIAGQPYAFGMKTNVDTETYLTDVYLTNENSPEPGVGSLDMTFDLVQVPSTKVDVKWVDVNQQPLARENTPATSLKDILTFNFIENRKFDLPNQDKVDSYFRLVNKIERKDIKDMDGATALVSGKKDGEVTLDGKIYKLMTSYNPAYNEGSKIQLMFMPDVIDRTKNPNAVTPENYVRVTIDAGEGTKLAQGETKKVYDVRVGKALKAEHYPKLEISDSAKYKEPITWTIAPGTAINAAADIKGNAAKTAAETITAANLKAVDTTALQGQDFPEKFWNDGVALVDNTPADKKAEFEALLKDATVTDKSSRTTAEAGDKVGTLLVTFKDGSKLEVPNQKLIVKPNTVTVVFDKAQGKEHPLRDGDTTVKGKITASSNSVKFPVSLDGAVVTIKKGDTVLTRTLANADGSFVAGVKDKLIAGEDISVVVTLPESKTASAPVTEKVQLNPDKLNSIIPTGQEVVKNLKGKKGVDQAKVTKLEEAITKAFTLVDKGTSAEDQMKKLPKATVTVDATGQKSLDDQYEAIKKAIEALTDNKIPTITGTAFKEIFKGDTLNLEAGIEVKDADSTQDESDIAQQDGKDFSYKVYTTNSENQKVEVKGDALTNLNQTPGTYEVVYTAKDKSGAEGTFTMTLVVKDIVYTKIAVTTDPTTTKYLVKNKDAKANVDYSGTVVTLTKNNGTTETATYDKATGKFKIGEKVIEELTIAPKEVAVAESPAVITATYEAGNTKLTAKANKAVIVQIDSDGNGVADTEENFDIAKAKSMEVTNQPILKYELDHKTGKAILDLNPLVVKVTDSLGNFKYFGYEEIKGDAKFALALGTDAFDKATAKELTTADNDKKVKVTLTYKENKTLEAETSAIKVEDKRPNVIENPTPGETREGYVSVKFNAGANGGLKGVNTFLVKKDTASSEVNAPTIVPAAGYKVKTANGGWDKAIPTKFTADFTATAQYEEDVATSETPKAGYTPITFDALDKGKIGDARTKVIYVNPAKEVNLSEKAPTVTANTGYSFNAWDPAIDTAKKYTKEERILATYTSDELISDKKKAGYIKVTFDQGKHGKFNVTDPAQKTDFWVKPGTLVDLREKAPKLTVDAGYIHTGWSPDLVVNFKADAGDQTITAQYGLDSDYSTTEKAGYTEITFDKGANGDFAKGAKTKLWVNPAKELTLPAPGIVPHPGYSHTGWTKNGAAVELNAPAKYTTATTITAAYESDISETEKAGFVKVSFDADKNGTIANNVKKDFWVNPNKVVNLTDKAPAVTPNSGYLFIKWDHKLVAKFEQVTTIKATYASAGDIKTEQTDGFTKVTFDAGENGKFAEGAQVSYWVNPDKELVLPEPRVIPNKGFEHTGWDPALTPAKKYTQATTIKATYKEEISTTPVEGHQEIKFLAGNDGTFADGKKEISIWVKPDTLVDLRKSAPAVTVTAEGKTFIGWDKDLVGSFKLEKENGQPKATVFKAQYSDKVSDTKVEGWTEITFKAGEHGNFGKDGTTPIVEKKLWVDPKSQVALDKKAPQVTANTNWLFDKWTDGNADATLSTPATYAEAKTFTANYKSVFSDKQEDGNVLITFKPGDNGRFAAGAKTTTYVAKNVAVDLAEKAPLVIPNQNYGHKGWKPELENTFTQATDITAQYEKGTFKADELASIDVFGPTKLSYAEGDKLDLAGLKIVVKDKAGIQETYEGAKAITDAGFTIAPANETPLTIDKHDKKPIKVSKEITVGQDKKTIEGQTVSTLSVSKNKSADPTDVLARNLGKDPKNTTVTGKAPEGSVIKVTDIDGKDLTDGTEVKANAKGEFTVTLKDKLAPGTPVKVTSTEPGKTESSPVVKQVFEDVNKDGTDDEKQKSAMPTDVKALNQNKVGQDGKPTKEEKETTTVTGKAKVGADIKIYNANGEDITPTGGVKADQDGNFTAEIPRQKDGDVIKVTAKEADKALPSDPALAGVAKDADNDGQADGERVTLRPSALARNIGTGTTTPKTPATFTTVEGDTEKDATVTVSYKVGNEEKTKVVKADTEGANGLYTYKAELDDKLPAGTKVTVKAVVVGKAESTATEAIVFEDLDGDKKPDGQGKVDFANIVEIKLASNPNKMDYALASAEDKDKATLDPTGLKVFLKDAGGNTGIYEYNKAQGSPFEELKGNENFKLELVNSQNVATEIKADTKLGKDDDQSKIKVSLKEKTDKFVETSAMKVYVDADKNNVPDKDETTTITSVIARNIGTGDPKVKATFTTIEGFAEPGSKVTVTFTEKGKQEVTTKTVDADKTTGAYKLELNSPAILLDADTVVKASAKFGDKKDSPTIETKVFEDLNADGKDDKAVNQKTDTPTAEAFNQNTVEDGKVTNKPKTTTTITGTAEKGAKVVAKVGDVKVGETTADTNTGEYTIEATKDGSVIPVDTEIKVTAQAKDKLVSDATATIVKRDADNNKKDDKAQDFDIKKATKVEIVENPAKMDYLVKSKEGKTNFETAGLVIKLTDSAGKEVKYTAGDLKNMTNEITVEPADQAEIGVDKNNTKLKVTVKGSDLTEKPSVESTKPITVQVDADGNGKADNTETTTITSVIARNIGTGTTSPKTKATFTTIEGVAEKGSTVTIKFQNKGQEVVKEVKADDQTGAYKLELKAGTEGITSDILLPAETDVKAQAKFGDKKPSGEIETKVFDDLDADGVNDKTSGNVTERPSALASNIGRTPAFTTITGEGEKGATITAKAKVNDQEVVVGTATVGSDGKYTIHATTDGTTNGTALKQGTLVSVTAKLDPKGESPAQTTHVFNDSDNKGQPDSSKDFNVKQAVKMEVVASPDKMVYNNGEKLNLNGLSVLITDVNGNQKIYKYEHNEDADKIEFIKAGLSVDLKQDTVLSAKDYDVQKAKDGHNGRKLVVTLDTTGNTAATEAITGETPTALVVNKDQTAKPTDVTAANQGSDTATKVRFKAADGAAIKIYKADDKAKANLIAGTPVVGTGKDAGYFIATLNTKLLEGTLVEITAKENGKKESSPEQAKVIRDKNSNWEGGKTIKLTAPKIDPIREKDEKVVVAAPNVNDKIKTIEVSDQKGNTVTLTKDATGDTWTVVGSEPAVKVEEKDGKIEIPVKDKLPLNDRDQIKVTFKDGENPANEVFDKAPVQKASQTPDVDPVYTGDKSVKIADPTVADPTAKTIKVKVGDKDSMIVEKQTDGSWKVKDDPDKKVTVKDGKVVVPLDPSAKKDEIIKVSTINDSGKASPAAEVKVKDKDLTKKPTIDKANKDENSVSGTAAPGAKITITVTPKGGQPKTFIGEANDQGNYKVTTDTLVDGDKVVAKASEPGKTDNTSDEKIVGVDTSKLKESIDKAEDPAIGGKDGANLDETKTIDKALKDALTEGKKVKEAGDNGDPNTDQKAVDKAKENLDKAIAQKEADKAVDKAKADPSDQNINDAQNKIDAIPGSTDPTASDHNPIKKDLQDKLDLIKKIKEGEDRLKQPDIKDKTPSDVEDLKKAVEDGKKVVDSKDSKTVTEATKAIEKAIDQINKERIKVGVESLGRGLETLEIRTSVPGATVVIKIGGKTIKTITTSSFGTYSQGLSEGLKADQDVTLEASKVGYNDGIYSETVV